jgi:hypothetical protein
MDDPEFSFESLEAIRMIKRELAYSYPYSAGTVTINCPGFGKKKLKDVIKYFMAQHYTITINYEKKQVKISGYTC